MVHCTAEIIKSSAQNQSVQLRSLNPVPEIIDPVFAKTSQNARFLLSENERFGHVFVKTGSINSGTVQTMVHCTVAERNQVGNTWSLETMRLNHSFQ
jgi:hypothetical protein